MKLSSKYEPRQYESDIYDLWLKSESFEPKNRGGSTTYSIVMPPANANGNLHIGHELTLVLEDISIRYHRMRGEPTLFLPGADHAGFETQAVYEKQLAKEGKSRFDFTREQLYEQIWKFVAKNRENFETQIKRMGASVDWSRYAFTLDDKIVKRAYSTFKAMWDNGLIYRGERLVNYCTFHRTSFADIEVVFRDAKTPLYYMKYGPFTLATTRPETKFGDTAVAVNPSDKRYKDWIGQVITVEGVNGAFEVQVVGDKMVDPKFGTGVVKITPAHDFNDWEVAQRHNLPAVRVINHDGTMNHVAGRFAGLKVAEARKAVVEALKEKGLLVKVDENYTNRVGHCYKCDTVIEPMLMEQWFVDMETLAKPAIRALEQKRITFYPDSKRTQLINYLAQLKDWNISRQIAWGIPIPAFQNVDDSDDWIFDERVDQEILKIDDKTYHRDPDVFDTWFSSSSWPYATMDYPDGKDYKDFYPLNLMETGGEILYPWVSRMVMLGLYVTGQVPFKAVYIHGYVMAEDGAKMSKSLGNVVDPLPVIDKFGSDALRMGIIAGRVPAVNRGYDQAKVKGARNFTNKLWNVARFIEGIEGMDFNYDIIPEPETAADDWILSKLQQSIREVSKNLDDYRFGEAYDNIYKLLWHDFADWYIEASKYAPNKSILAYSLTTILKLAHPMAPFVTETIWQTLYPDAKDNLLITSSWPKPEKIINSQAAEFEDVKAIVSEIRELKTALELKKPILLHADEKFFEEQGPLITRLAGVELQQSSEMQGLSLTRSARGAWLDIDRKTIKQYEAKLKESQKAQKASTDKLKARLANKAYVKQAPKEIVDQTKAQLSEAQEQLEKIEQDIKSLEQASKNL